MGDKKDLSTGKPESPRDQGAFLKKPSEPNAPSHETTTGKDLENGITTSARHRWPTFRPVRALDLKGFVPSIGRRRIIATMFLFASMTLAYAFIFYSREGNLLERLRSTVTNTNRAITDSYYDLKYPGTPEEVASMMGEFYEMLAEMGYYEHSDIAYPPHTNPGINASYASTLGYSQKAITMMEMLPYLDMADLKWNHGAGDGEFLLYGVFVDYREEGSLEELDPFYALDDAELPKGFDEPGGKYMKPDYILLSRLGNHGVAMVLNTKNYKLWSIDQESGNADFALHDREMSPVSNPNSLDNYPCRPSRLALRDYMQKFRDLEWIPGGLYNGSYEGDEYARLYRENGWPDEFRRDDFLKDLSHWEDENDKKSSAEEPFRKVEGLERSMEWVLESLQRNRMQVSELDQASELPEGKEDREQLKKQWLDEIKRYKERLPIMQEELEATRRVLEDIDPEIKRIRDARIKKYGEYAS